MGHISIFSGHSVDTPIYVLLCKCTENIFRWIIHVWPNKKRVKRSCDKVRVRVLNLGLPDNPENWKSQVSRRLDDLEGTPVRKSSWKSTFWLHESFPGTWILNHIYALQLTLTETWNRPTPIFQLWRSSTSIEKLYKSSLKRSLWTHSSDTRNVRRSKSNLPPRL